MNKVHLNYNISFEHIIQLYEYFIISTIHTTHKDKCIVLNSALYYMAGTTRNYGCKSNNNLIVTLRNIIASVSKMRFTTLKFRIDILLNY